MHNPDSRGTDWIPTFTGRRFWPFDPRPDDIAIEDIAHHLANVCRWSGATKYFYSVAQHSVLVSKSIENIGVVERDRVLGGLLHDAGEAYLGDWVRPVKLNSWFKDACAVAESRVQKAVAERFRIPKEYLFDEVLAYHDDVVLATEVRDLVPSFDINLRYSKDVPALEATIEPWDPTYAEHEFLCRFHELTEVSRG